MILYDKLRRLLNLVLQTCEYAGTVFNHVLLGVASCTFFHYDSCLVGSFCFQLKVDEKSHRLGIFLHEMEK